MTLKKIAYISGALGLAFLVNYVLAMLMNALLREPLTAGEEIQISGAVLLLGITAGTLGSYIPKDGMPVAQKKVVNLGIIISLLGNVCSIFGFGLVFSPLNQGFLLTSLFSIIVHGGLTFMFFGMALLIIESLKVCYRLAADLMKN